MLSSKLNWVTEQRLCLRGRTLLGGRDCNGGGDSGSLLLSSRAWSVFLASLAASSKLNWVTEQRRCLRDRFPLCCTCGCGSCGCGQSAGVVSCIENCSLKLPSIDNLIDFIAPGDPDPILMPLISESWAKVSKIAMAASTERKLVRFSTGTHSTE
jgi:hypothetical protein